MEITTCLLLIVLVLCLFNAALLIALAGAVAKLAQTMYEEEFMRVSRDEGPSLPSGVQYQMANGQWVETGTPTYDAAVLAGQAEPHDDGVDRRPKAIQNWDGVPRQ